jgi:hypothetical protein
MGMPRFAIRHPRQRHPPRREAPGSIDSRLQKRLLHWRHVLGIRTFRPAALGVFHSLAFLQIFEAITRDRGHVKEEIFSSARIDESKSFVQNLLDHALRHSTPARFNSSCIDSAREHSQFHCSTFHCTVAERHFQWSIFGSDDTALTKVILIGAGFWSNVRIRDLRQCHLPRSW